MGRYIVNRIDETAMKSILDRCGHSAAGVVLRLAWQAGLTRDEISGLSWSRVDFLNRRLELEDRTVPLTEELAEWLRQLQDLRGLQWERVLLSDRDHKPPALPSISRLAREALDAGGQTQVRLIDLRHDFILRQLAEHDWQYVSRISGDKASALAQHYGPLVEKKVSTRARQEKKEARVDEFRLWKLLQSERLTPGGTALWLTWQAGVQLSELVELRWEQVDLKEACLTLPERTVTLTGGVVQMLRELQEQAGESGWVIVSPRAGKPYDAARLSRLCRSLLIRGGLDDLTLRDLRLDYELRSGGEMKILAYLRAHHSITRKETMALLDLPRTTAYNRLKQMVQRGKLTQVGARYYLRDEVVPPEQQLTLIVEYLRKEGFAYRQDIANLLHIEPRQCGTILRRMVAEGALVQDRQRYALKEA
jgi:integrase